MTRFTVYTNPHARPPQGAAGPLRSVLRSVTSWVQGLLALVLASRPGSPTTPGPRPKAGALFGGARLSEKIEAVATQRAA